LNRDTTLNITVAPSPPNCDGDTCTILKIFILDGRGKGRDKIVCVNCKCFIFFYFLTKLDWMWVFFSVIDF